MATKKSTSIDEVDESLTSARFADVNPGIAEITRQEVQAAVKVVHEIYCARPTYSSSTPLLSSEPADEDADVGSNQPVTATPWTVCKAVITMLSLFAWMCAMAPLMGLGVDPLAFSMLAFFLVLALIYFVAIFACIQVRIAGKPKRIYPIPLTPEIRRQRVNGLLAMSLSFLGIYIMFYGIIWGWAVIFANPKTGVWQVYEVSRALQAKIDTENALPKLAACLQDIIPERNATIADISTCLTSMGIEKTYEKLAPTVLV
ncbi:hypothetical protein MMC17_006245 [Xylographa soralifera]|nr:hypothetical protein [Xylographa soralifera]